MIDDSSNASLDENVAESHVSRNAPNHIIRIIKASSRVTSLRDCASNDDVCCPATENFVSLTAKKLALAQQAVNVQRETTAAAAQISSSFLRSQLPAGDSHCCFIFDSRVPSRSSVLSKGRRGELGASKWPSTNLL